MMDWSPIFISMKTASVSILITFFVGLIVAWGIVKMKNDTIKIVLDGIFTLPIVLPPTVVGFFLLYIFGVRGPIGSFFIDFFVFKLIMPLSGSTMPATDFSVMLFPQPEGPRMPRSTPTYWMRAALWECLSGRSSGKYCLQMHCPESSAEESLHMRGD